MVRQNIIVQNLRDSGKENYMTNNIYEAKWTGSYPNLCSGSWHLYENGEEINLQENSCPFVAGPDDYCDSHANTYGYYSSWHFEDWVETADYYYDGLEAFDWVKDNIDWLSNISNNKEDWYAIYDAFNAEDFRPGSCMGCV